MFRFITVFILLLTILSCSKSKTVDNSLEEIQKKGYIAFGFHSDTPPLIFRKNGNTTGFLKEMISLIESELNIKIVFREIKDRIFLSDELNRKNIDMIFGPEADDDETFTSSISIISLNYSLLRRQGDSGSGKDYSLNSVSSEKIYFLDGFPEYKTQSSVTGLLSSLKSKKSSSILLNEATAQWIYQSYPEKYTVSDTQVSMDYAFLFRSNDIKLKKKVDEAIKKVLKTYKVRKLSKKWLGTDKSN